MSVSFSSPILLKAFPRSGGTLFITLLDAHPEIAMSYEIYESNLSDSDTIPLNPSFSLDMLSRDIHGDDIDRVKSVSEPHFRTFLFRAIRAGLCVDDICSVLDAFVSSGKSFSSSPERLVFIDLLMQAKSQQLKKALWGGKTQSDLLVLQDLHSDPVFFIMRRDFRDVYASMILKGNFKYSPSEAATLWVNNFRQFREFASFSSAKTMEIVYEDLALNPEIVLKDVCDLIGVQFSEAMLSFHTKNMALFRNPFGHLSCDQLKAGINSSSIGKWKSILNPAQIAEIEEICGDLIDF